jgi:hypothetical protein
VGVYGFDLSIISGFVAMMVTVNGELLGDGLIARLS